MIETVINFSDAESKKRLWGMLAKLKGQQAVTIKLHRKRRSLSANAWYWAAVIPAIVQGLQEAWGESLSADEAHEFLKDRYLSRPVVDRTSGEVVGRTNSSSAILNTEAFGEYLEKCIKFAGEDLGVEIQSLNEVKREAVHA